MSKNNGLTPTQRKMLAVLADGMVHEPLELHACLMDDLGPIKNISAHLTGLRKSLRPRGRDIISQRIDGKSYYRIVRLIRSE